MEFIDDFLEPYMLIGAHGILVESIRQVCKWEDKTVEIVSGNKRVTITGEDLKIEYKSLDSLLVKGKVKEIEFERKKR